MEKRSQSLSGASGDSPALESARSLAQAGPGADAHGTPSQLDRAIEEAARDLPDGYVLHLSVERGAAWVDFESRTYFCQIDGADRSLPEQVALAVRLAVENCAGLAEKLSPGGTVVQMREPGCIVPRPTAEIDDALGTPQAVINARPKGGR